MNRDKIENTFINIVNKQEMTAKVITAHQSHSNQTPRKYIG